MYLPATIAKYSVILTAACLVTWMLTGWSPMRWCAVGCAWVYVVVTVCEGIKQRRTRAFLGGLIALIGFGYAARALTSLGAEGDRGTSAMTASIVVAAVCLSLGAALLLSCRRETKRASE